MNERIDAHHHLWQYTSEDYGWITPDMSALRRDFMPVDLQREMQRTRLNGSIVVQARQSIAETRWLLECAETAPWIRGVVGWLPIAAVNFGTILDDFIRFGTLKGLRHVIQDEPDDNFILNDDFNSGIASMLGTGLIYDILIHERHLKQAAEFVRRHPEQIFVLDHAAKPPIRSGELKSWSQNLRRLAASGNVFCKLSGFTTEANWSSWKPEDLWPYCDSVLDTFGPERLMAGSDWPVCLLATGYGRWWDTMQEWANHHLNATQQDSLFGDTARQVYRLDEHVAESNRAEEITKGAA